MALKRDKQSGAFLVGSASDARLARERIDRLDKNIEDAKKRYGIVALEQEKVDLEVGLKQFLVDTLNPSETFDFGNWKATKVVGTMRKWNALSLRKLVPTAVYAKVTRLEVDAARVDDFVKRGLIDLDKVSAAFEETPKAPYVRWTFVDKDNREDEAGNLKEALRG
jgi:hypothetical protein